ncbi:hypothetical protein GBAR_LOCUS29016 [Geodia barretti]|uniref:Uncharacterized protein n=1 Tax=Geodia barretti TaxID=519541 RepID=A0AA35XD53_GEOBA|nr:hypothetical protein GBAR_LOCUS29016 [Geodia barretti]
MRTPVSHSVVRRKDIRSFLIAKVRFNHFNHAFDLSINETEIFNDFLRSGSVRVAVCVNTEKMKEKHDLVVGDLIVKFRVARSPLEKLPHPLKHPRVEFRSVRVGKVLPLCVVHESIHLTRGGSLGKHGEDVGASPGPGVVGAVEDRVKRDGVITPAVSDRTYIFVESGYQCHVPRS